MARPIIDYGWAAQPRDPAVILKGRKHVEEPVPQTVEGTKLPDTYLAKAILEHAKKELREETFNHSMRVFYYGIVSIIGPGILVCADLGSAFRESYPHSTVSGMELF